MLIEHVPVDQVPCAFPITWSAKKPSCRTASGLRSTWIPRLNLEVAYRAELSFSSSPQFLSYHIATNKSWRMLHLRNIKCANIYIIIVVFLAALGYTQYPPTKSGWNEIIGPATLRHPTSSRFAPNRNNEGGNSWRRSRRPDLCKCSGKSRHRLCLARIPQPIRSASRSFDCNPSLGDEDS